jgi:hypothetical protein
LSCFISEKTTNWRKYHYQTQYWWNLTIDSNADWKRKVQRHFCVDFSCVMLVNIYKKVFYSFSISVSPKIGTAHFGQCQNEKFGVDFLECRISFSFTHTLKSLRLTSLSKWLCRIISNVSAEWEKDLKSLAYNEVHFF